MHAAGGSRGGVPWRASPGLHFSHLIHDDMTHNSLSGCMGTPQLVGAWGCGGRVGLMVLCPSRTKMCQEMGKTSAHVTGRELGAWVAWLEPQKRAELGCGSWGRRAGGASPAGRTRARGTPQKPMCPHQAFWPGGGWCKKIWTPPLPGLTRLHPLGSPRLNPQTHPASPQSRY